MSKENDSSFQCAFEKALKVITTTDSNENDRIECEVCKGIFFMRHHFNSHICNEKAKQISCQICWKTFTSNFRLKQHSFLHSGVKPVECKICRKRFSHTYYPKHLQTHSDIKRYKCKICDKSYRYSNNLKTHMFSHTGEKPHKCKYCGRQFRVKSILRVHLTTHEAKTHKCLKCPKVFSTRYYLKVHMGVHESHKPFKCETCDKCFAAKIALRKHMKTHLGKNFFRCDQCPKMFTRKQTLSVHIRCTHDRDTTNLEKCHVCNQHFMYKSRLRQHMATHAKFHCLFCFRPSDECICLENPENYSDFLKKPFARDNFMFKCQTCSRILLRQSQLKIHMKKHRDYKCVVCDEDYKNCSCSDNHIEVSKSKNTYKKSNKPSTNVDKQSKEISVVNPEDTTDSLNTPFVKDRFMFKCQSCSRIILRKAQLKIHMRIHPDYKCVVCNEDYRNCTCSDDHMEVPKSVNTYQKVKRSKSSRKKAAKAVKPAADEVQDKILTSTSESIEFNELIISKDEPNKEIGENSVGDCIFYIEID